MRIALICVSLRGGGTERIVSRIANFLAEGHDVTVVTLAPRTPFFPLHQDVKVLQDEISKAGAPKPLRMAYQIAHLFSAMRTARPELCMIFGEDIAAAGILISRAAGCRRIWNFFRGRPERSIRGLTGRLSRLACRLSESIFVQTVAGQAALGKFYSPSKLTVWPNPIEIPTSVSPPEKREALIVNVGSIGRLKNQIALVRIFDGLDDEEAYWELLFIGDGPDRAVLESSARSASSASRICLIGEVQDVAAYLDRAAIFAFTSLSEGFPNALAEAMAAGCACISYDCVTGPAELIEHGVNGFLVEPGNEVEYSRLLQRLKDEPELRAQFSRNARESMKRFDAGVVMERLDRMIEEVADNPLPL